MGTIYNAPEGFDPPDIQKYSKAGNFDKYFKDCEKYVKNLKKTIKKGYGKACPEAGEEIHFPVGDGAARYIVATLKPVRLIHLAVGDAWQYQYAHRLTASDIRKEIKQDKEWKRIWASKKKG
jgi:hypothetical protein